MLEREDLLIMMAISSMRYMLNPSRELTQDELVKEQLIVDMVGAKSQQEVLSLLSDTEKLYTKLLNKLEEDTYGEFTGIIN